MTTPLTLIMTNAGIARFTAAQIGNGTDLRISAVGVTDSVIVVSPTLTALPGESRRIATISGVQVGNDVVHLMVRDDGTDEYAFRAFGLYLADGTLFAVYGQAERIMQKAARAANFLAIDIVFPASTAQHVGFGDTNFVVPPTPDATTELHGIVELATEAEGADGTDEARVPPVAVVAKMIAARLAALAGYVVMARKVIGTGLATGGGALDADRTIDVAAATVEETTAGLRVDRVVTPGSLAGIITSIAAKVKQSRRIDTIGLALGGGSLATDLTISVPPATAAQMRAGSASDVAATPSAVKDAGFIYVVRSNLVGQGGYREWSDGFIEQWGLVDTNITTERAFTITFPIPFVAECFRIDGTVRNTTQSTVGSHQVQEVSVGLTEAIVFLQSDQTTTSDAAGGFRWRATGR